MTLLVSLNCVQSWVIQSFIYNIQYCDIVTIGRLSRKYHDLSLYYVEALATAWNHILCPLTWSIISSSCESQEIFLRPINREVDSTSEVASVESIPDGCEFIPDEE